MFSGKLIDTPLTSFKSG